MTELGHERGDEVIRKEFKGVELIGLGAQLIC